MGPSSGKRIVLSFAPSSESLGPVHVSLKRSAIFLGAFKGPQPRCICKDTTGRPRYVLRSLDSKASQPLQINVANSSKIEFYRRAKKRFLPLVWAILSFFSAFILKLCFLFNNLPSNVRKVPPKSFDGQKMALH